LVSEFLGFRVSAFRASEHFVTLALRNSGTLALWNLGTLKLWNLGTLELWNFGTLEPLLEFYNPVGSYCFGFSIRSLDTDQINTRNNRFT